LFYNDFEKEEKSLIQCQKPPVTGVLD